MNFIRNELLELDRKGLRRNLLLRESSSLNFSTNDYLNLSVHPTVIRRAKEATEIFGTGSRGSRLMTGNLSLHEELEEKLAELTCMDSALVFGSGFLANFGVISALAGRQDVIFCDRMNHASLVDGALNSRASVKRYRHRDVEHLARMLQNESTTGKKLIVTDSLFSMDGDIAPLCELSALAKKYNCILIVDEAHSIGVFGRGRGICREMGVKPDILTGTLSKALGGYGGFAACSREIRDYLVNRSRSFIYTTGLPPASAGAALGAIEVLQAETGLGEELLDRASLFRRNLENLGLDLMGSTSQVIPVVTGEPQRAMELSSALLEKHVLAVAIRPPTVPEGTSRLRFSVTLAHSAQELVRTTHLVGELL